MKGLGKIPSQSDLRQIYEKLQTNPSGITLSELALWSQFARFDPRLAEQWVAHLRGNWIRVPSEEFRILVSQQPWPQAAAVLLEFIALSTTSFADEQRKSFSHWLKSSTSGIGPLMDTGEQYFIGHRSFGGKMMAQDVEYRLEPYRKWGYSGREVLYNKAQPGRLTLNSAETRRRVLEGLLKTRQRLTVADYRGALGGWVSVRQAELDLSKTPRLQPRGSTRGRFYVVTSGARRKT